MNKATLVAGMVVALAWAAGVMIGRPGRFAMASIVVIAGALPGLWLGRWWGWPHNSGGTWGGEYYTVQEELSVWPDGRRELRRVWIERDDKN